MNSIPTKACAIACSKLMMRRFEAMEPRRAAVIAMEAGQTATRSCLPPRTNVTSAARAGCSHSQALKPTA